MADHRLTPHDDRLRGDRRILRHALLVAIALHLIALWVPLPARRIAPVAARPEPVRPEIVPWEPELPDIRPPEFTDFSPQPRRRPLPVRDHTDAGPIDEPEVLLAAHANDLTDLVEFLPVQGTPPPAPEVRELGTVGLIPPVLVDRVEPVYPAMGRRARQGGRVMLRAVIDEVGFVRDLEVVEASSPDLGFSDAALEAVRRWRYTPGTLRGRPVPVSMTVFVDFTIQ